MEKMLLIQVNNIKVRWNMSWKRLIQMLYKRSNKLLLGYKKIIVPLFPFREPPLKWKNNFKLQNVMVAIKTVQTFFQCKY